MMHSRLAACLVLLVLPGCLAKTELADHTTSPALTLSPVVLSVEADPCLPGKNDENAACLVKAELTEPTTNTDGTPIGDLRGIRFSWAGDWGTNFYESDDMFLDSPSPNGGHKHTVTFYVSTPKCGTEVVRSTAYAITHSRRRSQEAKSQFLIDRRGDPGCPGQP